MSRYFVSITLPDNIQKSLDLLLPENRVWKKTNQNQLHLTLRYIGDADTAVVNRIGDKLRRITIPEFKVRLKGVGFFPEIGRVRVIWIGAEKSSPLMELQGLVDSAVAKVINSESEHTFTPHVTLVRIKGGVNREKVLSLIPEIKETFECQVKSFQLMESRQGRDGVEHLTVKSYQLKPI